MTFPTASSTTSYRLSRSRSGVVVVNDLFGAESAHEFGVGGAGHPGDDRAGGPRQLHRRTADGAGCAVDEHAVSRSQCGLVLQVVQSGTRPKRTAPRPRRDSPFPVWRRPSRARRRRTRHEHPFEGLSFRKLRRQLRDQRRRRPGWRRSRRRVAQDGTPRPTQSECEAPEDAESAGEVRAADPGITAVTATDRTRTSTSFLRGVGRGGRRWHGPRWAGRSAPPPLLLWLLPARRQFRRLSFRHHRPMPFVGVRSVGEASHHGSWRDRAS